MTTSQKVSVVVVTYNRLALLKQAIASIMAQESPALSHVIIVNGASTDGTKAYLDALDDSRLIIEHLPKNVGGAGGFNHGIKTFMQRTNDDYVWVMDDDSLPRPEALARLLAVFDMYPTAGMASSKVEWTDGSWSKMNVQAAVAGGQNAILMGADRYVPIKHATFVGTMFTRSVVAQIGLPQKEYFIWGDDIEYTERATQITAGYFVRDSIVVHASQTNPQPGDITGEEIEARLPRYLKEYRNRLETARRRRSIVHYFKTLAHTGLDFGKTLVLPGVQYRWRKLAIIIQGTWHGLFFRPAIEYVEEKNSDGA
jgi:GT2 family glycosyltransferase